MSKKKNRIAEQDAPVTESPSGGKGRKSREIFSFLGVTANAVPASRIKNRLLWLVGASLGVKLVLIFATTLFLSILVGIPGVHYYDAYDFQYYYQSMEHITQGQLPYADFSFDYPPLTLLPICLAFIPAYIFNSGDAFLYTFQLFMILCDIVTVICVYLVGLKLYNEKTAFVAALLYATAFSTAYFALTKNDAFPTCLLMLAVLFAVYNKSLRGYIADVLGFLAKIFPVIALPFVALYNAKSTSLKEEVIAILKVGIPVAVIVLVPVLILRPGIILSYISGSLVRADVYANTATNTVYTYLHDVLNLGIDVASVSTALYIIMGLVLIFLVAIAYIEPDKDTRFLIKLLAIAIFVVVFCMKYHSPQYIMWFTPFVCLLVADSLYGIILFFVTQAITYLEFPLLYGHIYFNDGYTGDAGTPLWYAALLFFTINFAAYIVLMYIAVKPTGSHARMLLEKIRKPAPEKP